MIRMIGLDLDGTLLTRDKRLTDGNRAVLEEASRRGIEIVPVTGRPLSGIPEAVLDLPFIRYAISSNGAVVTDRLEKRAVREHYMTVETAEQVLEAARGENVIREYFAGGYGFHDKDSRRLLWKRFGQTPVISYIEKSRIQVEDLQRSLAEKTQGIENISIMCASYEDKLAVLDKIEKIEGIRIIYPWPTDLEITAPDADKGDAFLSLARSLGFERDEVMAMGDANNDLGLMKAAGFAVAMGNSAPEIMEAADYVTYDNEHDGVAEAIRRYVLEKGE